VTGTALGGADDQDHDRAVRGSLSGEVGVERLLEDDRGNCGIPRGRDRAQRNTWRDNVPPGSLDEQDFSTAVDLPGAHLVLIGCTLGSVADLIPREHVQARGR